MDTEKRRVRILLDEMFGRNFERSFISVASNAGLGETVLLRANEPEFIPLDFLIDDFRILRFARKHGFILVTCNTKDTFDRFPTIHQAYQKLRLEHSGILCCQQRDVDRRTYHVVRCLTEWLREGLAIYNQCQHLRPMPSALESPMPFRGAEDELQRVLHKVRLEEEKAYPAIEPFLRYTETQWEQLTIAYRSNILSVD